jgi:phospholipid/cholesterol/gamma-HCH transport system ATP-binding protein
VIRARGVRFAFPGRPVLEDITLDIEESLTTVVVGRSGIGKSVFLKCITGLLRPQAGSITNLLAIRKRVGMLFQEGALFDSMSVFENVAFPLMYHKLASGKEINRRVQAYLDLVGMPEYSQAMPQELSGGMKRKVAVARAMITEPRYLLYDEPTAGLDPASAAVVESMIRGLQREGAITSLVVTHDIDLTRYIADRIALMEDGRISADAAREDAFQESSAIYEHFIVNRERIRAENDNQG